MKAIEKDGWSWIEGTGYVFGKEDDWNAIVSYVYREDEDGASYWMYAIYNKSLDMNYMSGGGYYDFEEYEDEEEAMIRAEDYINLKKEEE